jgi:hypothetical protein
MESLPLCMSSNVSLDNYEHELLALILDRPLEEVQNHKDIARPSSAGRDFERILSCKDCLCLLSDLRLHCLLMLAQMTNT